MPKQTVRRVYSKHYSATCKNAAKSRRGGQHFKTGKYKKAWDRTEANRALRQAKHKLRHPKDLTASAL